MLKNKFTLSIVSWLVISSSALATAYTFPGDFVPGTTELSASGDSLTNSGSISNDPTGVSMTNTSGTTTLTNTAGSITASTDAVSGTGAGTKTVDLNGGTITGDISNSTGTMNVTFGGSTTTTFAGEFDSVDSVSVAADSTLDFTTATSITSALDATGSGAVLRFTGTSRTVSSSTFRFSEFSEIEVASGITLSASTTGSFILNSTASRPLTISGAGTINLTGGSLGTAVRKELDGVFSIGENVTVQGNETAVSLILNGSLSSNAGTIVSTDTSNPGFHSDENSGTFTNNGSISNSSTGTGVRITTSKGGNFINQGSISGATAVSIEDSDGGTTIFRNMPSATVTTTGTDAINISGSSGTATIQLWGGTITGRIREAASMTANIEFGNSQQTTVTGDISGINDITVASGATANLGGTVGATTFTNSGTVKHSSTGVPVNYSSAGTFTNSAGTVGTPFTTTALQNNSTGTVNFNVNGGTINGDIKKNSSGTTNVTFGGSTTTTFAHDFVSVDSISVAASSTLDLTTITAIPGTITGTGSGAGLRLTGNSRDITIGDYDISQMSSVYIDEGITLTFTDEVRTIAVTSSGYDLSITGGGNIYGTGSNLVFMSVSPGSFSNSSNLQAGSNVVLTANTTGGTNTGTITSTEANSTAWLLTGSSTTGTYSNSGTITSSNGTSNGTLVYRFPGVNFDNSGTISSTNSNPAVYFDNSSGTATLNNTGTISSLGTAITSINSGTRAINLNGGTVTGNISNPAGTMNLTFGNNATTEFSGTLSGIDSLTVNSGATAKFTNTSASHTITGSTVSIAGTLDITGSNSNGNLTIPTFTATSANPSMSGGSVIISTGGGFIKSQQLTLIDGNASATAGASVTFSPANSFVSASTSASGGDILLIIERIGYEVFSNSPLTKGMAEALEILGNNPNITAAHLALLNGIDNATADLDETLQQLIPDTVPSMETVMIQDYGIRKVETRIAELNKRNFGYVAGTPEKSNNAWVKFIGNKSGQNNDDDIVGYNSTSAGFALGYDHDVTLSSSLGVALASSVTKSKQKNNTRTRTDATSVQGMLYGTNQLHHFIDYANWIFSFGQHDYKSTRAIELSTISGVANSEYKGRQYAAKLILGKNIEITDKIVLSPEISGQQTFWWQQAYAERGDTGLNLTVNTIRNRKLELGVGGHFNIFGGEETIYKELEFRGHIYYNDVNGLNGNQSRITTTSVILENTSSSVNIISRPKPFGLKLGVSAILASAERLDLKISYDMNAQKGFRSHTGSLEFRYWF